MVRSASNGRIDKDVAAVERAVVQYTGKHPRAAAQVKRQNSVSIRIRVIDPDFRGVERADRDDELWKALAALPERVRSQITMLLLLAPDEIERSIANLEFESPITSRL